MKTWIRRFAAGAALCASLWSYAEAAPPNVPENIYQWVQSSERMNYFFNKEAIAYGVDQQGYVDLNILVVPVIKTYDDVQIADVRMKREWRLESTEALSDLAGEANYLTFDVARQTVMVDAVDLIDSHFSAIEHSEPKRLVEVASLTEKSRDGIFYRAIFAYAKEHPEELLAHTKDGTLRPEDRAYLDEEEKRLEKEKKEEAKRLEKERKEEAKRLEKERKEEEKRIKKERREEEKRIEKERREEKKRLEAERRAAKERGEKAAAASIVAN